MRRAWRYLNYWPNGWLAVPLAVVIAFCSGLIAGFALHREASEVVPMAVAGAFGGGIAQAWRVMRPKPPRTSAWPSLAPPPGRRD
jgi:hypothetical protein